MTTAMSPLQKTIVTLSLMLATIMQALDTTIANVALPHMQGALGATQEQSSWILTSYIVAAAIMTAPTGILAARLGRKNLFLFCVAGFTATSMLCGIATGLGEMVVFRLLQGVFGAGLVPLSQAVLLDINPPEKHGQAMALWGVGVMLGPILGPTLGGFLTENYNWRWIFYINLPLGALAFAGLFMFMEKSERDASRKFDIFGFALLSLFIGALQLMLDRGATEDWFSSAEVITECVVSFVAFYLFVVHVLTARHPFLEPAMFRDKNYSACLFFIFIIGIILLSTMALLPPYLSTLMNYPVIMTGLVLAPRGLGTMVAMMLVGRLLGRVDTRLLILTGLLLTAYSLYQMSLFAPQVPVSLLVETGLVQGFGMGFVFVPLSTLAYATLAPRFRNDATAIFSLVRNIGSSIGISVMVALIVANTQINHGELATHIVGYGNNLAQMQQMLGPVTGSNASAGLVYMNGLVTQQAAAISYLNDFRLMMYVVLLAVPFLALIKVNRRKQHVDLAAAME